MLTLSLQNDGTFCLQIVNNALPPPSGNASRYIPAPISTHNISHISLCFTNTNILSNTLCFCLYFLLPKAFSHFLMIRVTFSQSVAMICHNFMYLFTWILIYCSLSYFIYSFVLLQVRLLLSKIPLWVLFTISVVREDVFKIKYFGIIKYPIHYLTY